MDTHSANPPGPQADWVVQPHGPLIQCANDVWTVVGMVRMPLTDFLRRMTLVTLGDGRLVVYSAISLDEPGMRQVESLGDPAFLVVPGAHHRLDAAAWKRRYPAIVVCAPAGAAAQIEDAVHVNTTAPDFGDARVRCVNVAGTHDREFALEVQGDDGTTLVLNDVVANMPDEHGVKGLLLRAAGFSGEEPQVPRIMRMTLVDDKDALRRQLEDWAARGDLERILVSHGAMIEGHPREVLRGLAGSLG